MPTNLTPVAQKRAPRGKGSHRSRAPDPGRRVGSFGESQTLTVCIVQDPSSLALYVPILKGRMGEFRALSELDAGFSRGVVPLIELPLTAEAVAEEESPDFDDEPPIAPADVAKFTSDVARRWAPGRRLIFDAGPALGPRNPAVEVINGLAPRDFAVTPTVRPSDSENAIRHVGGSIREWNLGSACIRLTGDDLDDFDAPLPQTLQNVLDLVGLPPDRVDLVLDFGPVADDQAAAFSARIARLVLAELPFREEWRTLVCAAGAFPPDLNSIPSGVLTEIPRRDAAMWLSIRERVSGRAPIFGDYAIAYPIAAAAVPFAPAPQLRFTSADSWMIFKGRKRDPRGNDQFYDICSRIVSTGAVDPHLSWGDRYVFEAGYRRDTTTLGPGNAMTWRAIGTSHHIAYVANRLANHGAP